MSPIEMEVYSNIARPPDAHWYSVEEPSESLILEPRIFNVETGDYSWEEWVTICKVFGLNPRKTLQIRLDSPFSFSVFGQECPSAKEGDSN